MATLALGLGDPLPPTAHALEPIQQFGAQVWAEGLEIFLVRTKASARYVCLLLVPFHALLFSGISKSWAPVFRQRVQRCVQPSASRLIRQPLDLSSASADQKSPGGNSALRPQKSHFHTKLSSYSSKTLAASLNCWAILSQLLKQPTQIFIGMVICVVLWVN